MEQHLSLDDLVERGTVWRGRQGGADTRHSLPSGWTALDRLIGGGWPRGALTELLSEQGCGLGLLVPVLADLSREGRWLVWVAPPWLPYAPAMAAHGVRLARNLLIRAPDGQRLWAAEQALRSHGCGAVLSWPGTLTVPQVRRLQLASERGGGLGLVFRPAVEAGLASPAALRLLVRPEGDALRVKVLKRPGGWAGEEVRIAC